MSHPASVEEQYLDQLSDAALFARLDPHDMLGLVLKFPRQCREGATIGRQFPAGAATGSDVRQVVITGLGGSAIGGDFARALMEEYGTVPLVVNRDYTLPSWVGPHTLVIAASYSGNTEETLAAYDAAKAAGAQRMVVTSGGKLRERAEADGTPIALVPGGQPPRSATGYMFFPALAYLAHRGLLHHDLAPDIAETLSKLEAMAVALGPEVPTPQNPAKQMAVALQGKLSVIYGSQGYRGAVAYRWKSQFNENVKEFALANVFPEQNHNEILAWVTAQNQAQTWAAIFLREPNEKAHLPRIARRVEVGEELAHKKADVHELVAEGDSLLTRLFHLVYFADFVTVYLAYLHGVCPTDIGSIDYLKEEMAKLG